MASSLPTHCLECEVIFSLLKPPLFLPCGHALCKICTSKRELESNRKCPTCKNTWKGNLIEASYVANFKKVASTEESAKTLTVEEDQQKDSKADSEHLFKKK